MNATQKLIKVITDQNKSDDVLIGAALLADNLTGPVERMTSAAICEVLINRHPEIRPELDVFMYDYETELSMIEFIALAITK
ncbi:hypothetical protein SAMN04489740_2712 [Arthrobacter alpinus]|uniref:Uncharacterized protein n=1 Tax=Arthrobacter alpinus TaxID=656366 RepID=A0A1H5M279_9MICC|nr:hypothetical protein [Arthrobacter alpinus]SEE83250.1 hypothetical protein SAMN04489740_2712 [Arthrobacter alpinus]